MKYLLRYVKFFFFHLGDLFHDTVDVFHEKKNKRSIQLIKHGFADRHTYI